MTRRQFCEQHNLPLTTLDAWRRTQNHRPSLVQVAIESEPQQNGSGFALVLRNGWRIESAWNFAEGDLLRLIRMAEG